MKGESRHGLAVALSVKGQEVKSGEPWGDFFASLSEIDNFEKSFCPQVPEKSLRFVEGGEEVVAVHSHPDQSLAVSRNFEHRGRIIFLDVVDENLDGLLNPGCAVDNKPFWDQFKPVINEFMQQENNYYSKSLSARSHQTKMNVKRKKVDDFYSFILLRLNLNHFRSQFRAGQRHTSTKFQQTGERGPKPDQGWKADC